MTFYFTIPGLRQEIAGQYRCEIDDKVRKEIEITVHSKEQLKYLDNRFTAFMCK